METPRSMAVGGVNAVRPGRTRILDYDPALLTVVIATVLYGLVMVYSASIALADGPRFESVARHHFLLRHALFIGLGTVFAGLVYTVSMAAWQRLAMPAFVLAMGLLVLVLIPGIGTEVNGAWRWLRLGFGFNLQPSEVMKLAALLYAADYTVRKQEHMQEFFRGFVPLALAMGLA